MSEGPCFLFSFMMVHNGLVCSEGERFDSMFVSVSDVCEQLVLLSSQNQLAWHCSFYRPCVLGRALQMLVISCIDLRQDS